MEKLTINKILKIIGDYQNCSNSEEMSNVLKKHENDLFKPHGKKAVLGIDIYKYSQYPTIPQVLIPYIFNELRTTTIKTILTYEPFIFQKHTVKGLTDNFIDTGDGGFQILDNPIEAILFAIYFQLNLHGYNSGEPLDGMVLNNLIGEIKLRYVITHDDIYRFNNNFYGVAVINNARILAKDKLDRCLIDQNVVNWFYSQLNGFQNLSVLDDGDFKDLDIFDNFDYSKIGNDDKLSFIFDKIHKKAGGAILCADIMHIGEVLSKQTSLSVHCAYVQTHIRLPRITKKFKKIVASLGSLNPSGINDKI